MSEPEQQPRPKITLAPKAPEIKTAPLLEEMAPKQEPVWRPMTIAPRDGAFLIFKNDPNEGTIPNEWYWYQTRQYIKDSWKIAGWWRRRFGPNCAPSFTPEGWRYAKEGLPA